MPNATHEHIINLSIKCKNATGDGTKIVCLNSDYVVRIATENCGTFTSAAVKKLIVRHGKEYTEVDIETKTDTTTGQIYLQATLPPIEWKDFVYLGVCGKDSENADPTYTSTSAKFECENSVLNGVVVLKKQRKLIPLSVTKNGTYKVSDLNNIDGYNQVTVDVPTTITETVAVNLELLSGNQEVKPTHNGYSMEKVIIIKPEELISENIRYGIKLAGVVGTYSPDYDGKVTVVGADEASGAL